MPRVAHVSSRADLERNLSVRTTREELVRRGVLKDVEEVTSAAPAAIPEEEPEPGECVSMLLLWHSRNVFRSRWNFLSRIFL